MKKKKLLFTLGGGGHTAQIIELTKYVAVNYQCIYIVNDDDNVSKNRIIKNGKIYTIKRPRKYDKNIFITFYMTVICFWNSYKFVKKVKFDAIISAGPGLAIPLFFWSKMFGRKTIFIESWSRVTTKSLSGKICYLLSSLFFVQWRDMLKKYPNSIYAGRLG